MIVVTLTKVPKSLQGDLTKWYQEIQTGVYVGSVSARIRDALWNRILENIGRGEATMIYNSDNEIGYFFRTTRKDRQVIDLEGVPLMMHLKESIGSTKHGFSDAAKFHRAKIMTRKTIKKVRALEDLSVVSLDIETTGLDPTKDEIISIGAVKHNQDKQIVRFYQLVRINQKVPLKITELTGITDEILKNQGIMLADALQELRDFIADMPIVGYNLRFDEAFLTAGYRKIEQVDLSVKMIDLMPIVKKSNKFLDNYRLKTVLADYSIENKNPHHALSDAEATFELVSKLKENGVF